MTLFQIRNTGITFGPVEWKKISEWTKKVEKVDWLFWTVCNTSMFSMARNILNDFGKDFQKLMKIILKANKIQLKWYNSHYQNDTQVFTLL